MAAERVRTNVGVLKDVPVLVSHDSVAAFCKNRLMEQVWLRRYSVLSVPPVNRIPEKPGARTALQQSRTALGQFAPSLRGVGYGESNLITGCWSLGDPNGEKVPGPDLTMRSIHLD